MGRRTVDCKKGLGLSFNFGLSASRLLKPILLAINPLKHGGFCAGVRSAFQLQRMFTGVVWFLPKISFRNCAKNGNLLTRFRRLDALQTHRSAQIRNFFLSCIIQTVHFPKFCINSGLPLQEGRAATAWEASEQ